MGANIALEMGVSRHTVSSWMGFVKQTLKEWAMHVMVAIGGPGKVVEIDESKLEKRKYNVGHAVEGQCVFGGIKRETSRIFLVPVENPV